MDAVSTVQHSEIEMQEYSHTRNLIAHFKHKYTIIRGRKHNRATLH